MSEFDGKIEFREWDEYNLHEDAAIDKYSLDINVEGHSHIMQKWLELLTKAQSELSKAKEVLSNVEAKLLLKVKIDGVPELGTKPTEATVKAWVHTQPEARKAQRRKRKAENNVQYLQNAKTVLEHRKSMLKIESDLWICGFFAKPMVSGEVKQELDENRKRVHARKLEESLSKRHKRQKENDNG